MSKSNQEQRICKCPTYNFPHRLGGGDCKGQMQDDEPNCATSYVHSRKAWDDAGVSDKDFGLLEAY